MLVFQQVLDVHRLIGAQRQADHVDVVAAQRPQEGGTPPAADVEQRHPWPQSQLAERQGDLGDPGLFEGHVVAFEIGTAIRLRRIQEKPVKVVGDVVMVLDIGEMRFEAWCGRGDQCRYPFFVFAHRAL